MPAALVGIAVAVAASIEADQNVGGGLQLPRWGAAVVALVGGCVGAK